MAKRRANFVFVKKFEEIKILENAFQLNSSSYLQKIIQIKRADKAQINLIKTKPKSMTPTSINYSERESFSNKSRDTQEERTKLGEEKRIEGRVVGGKPG